MNSSLEALIAGLKLAIKSATPGQWSFARSGANVNVQAPVNLQRGAAARAVLCSLKSSQWRNQLATAHDAAFIALANPENIAALIAVLEQAQTKREVFLPLSVPAGWKLVPTTATPSMVRAGAGAARKYMEETGGNSPYVIYEAMVLEAPIAELEARQLTVKIPDRKADVFWPGDASEFDSLGYEMAVREAIRAAGGHADA